jgi:integrase
MSIVKLGEGRYRIFVDLGRDASGRRRRHNEVIRGTKRDAERREREVRRSVDTGSYVEPNALTVADYLRKWLDSVQAKVQERTYQGYEQKVRTHLIPDLGRIKLTELRPLHVEEAEALWLRSGNRRTGGPLDPQTLLHIPSLPPHGDGPGRQVAAHPGQPGGRCGRAARAGQGEGVPDGRAV